MTTRQDTLVDTAGAFKAMELPDDRAERIAILKKYRWFFDKETSMFRQGRFKIPAGVVRILPMLDLEYSCAYPERVWPNA